MKKTIKQVFPRPVKPGMVGDGFRVFNYIPSAVLQPAISPFLMLDFNAAWDFGPSEHIRGVDVHPHKGFETVTIAYQGSVAHYDSTGSRGVIHPGDVQWMTAGKGILHKEFHEEQFSRSGGPFEMVQLWVNLPAKDKGVEPHYQAITADMMGKIRLEDNGGVVNVIAGTANGVEGPASTYTPVNLFDIRLNVGGAFRTTVPATHHTALLVVSGSVEVNGTAVPEHAFVLFGQEGEEIAVVAGADSKVLLLSGEPIQEPIASYGPFVMNTQAEIREAIMDYNLGKFGVLD